LPRILGIDPHWGGAGLTVSFGIAGWVEFALLRRGMNQRVGETGLAGSFAAKLWGCAAAAGTLAFGLKAVLPAMNHIVAGGLILGAFAVVYGLAAVAVGIPEARSITRRFRSRS